MSGGFLLIVPSFSDRQDYCYICKVTTFFRTLQTKSKYLLDISENLIIFAFVC